MEDHESIKIDDVHYRRVREGGATILAPYSKESSETQKATNKKSNKHQEGDQAVFYNPIQQFNRDLSVLAILAYGEPALLEKSERYRKKHDQLKRQRGNAKQRRAGESTAPEAASRDDNEVKIKRKRIDADSDQPLADFGVADGGGNAKRAKIDDDNDDPDQEEWDVMQVDVLGISDGHPAFNKHCPSFTILDALSATGLRALRYAKEIPFVTTVVANDMSRSAVKSIERNIDDNGLRGKVRSNVDDARAYMYKKVGHDPKGLSGRQIHRFDVIDLDPYGTAAPFFDAALQVLQDGGLLCVTCTDAGVFASNSYPEKAFSLYGGIPIKGAYSHEGGLRLILQAIATSAAKYGIAIEPLLSLSIDFYARLFLRIHKQPVDVKLLAGTTMIVYSCDYGCGAWTTQPVARNTAKESRNGNPYFKHSYAQGPNSTPLCDHCGSKTHLSGPMWGGPIHNPYFIQRILDKLPFLHTGTYATIPRIEGMLTVALAEDINLDKKIVPALTSPVPVAEVQQPETEIKPIPRLPPSSIDPTPFFFVQNYLAKVLRCQTPSEDALRGALRHLNYRVTRSHCKAGSIKTDAPWSVIWEIMREWTRTKMPAKEGAVTRGTAGWGILARERGSERAKAKGFQEEVTQKLSGADSLADVGTVLEAALFRLAKEKGGSFGNEEQEGTRTVNTHLPDGSEDVVMQEKKKTTALKDLDIVFDEELGKDKSTRRLCRYQLNPRPNWGPMNRAGGN